MKTKSHEVIFLVIVIVATLGRSNGFDAASKTTVATQKTAGIPLTRNGRVNGYTVTQKGPNAFEFGATNVQDPVTKKPVTGNAQLQYKCGQVPPLKPIPYIGRLFVNQGNSDHIKVECLILITPRIIIQDE